MIIFFHQVGKWHLGFCNTSYLPTNRGFQSFFGQLSQVLDLGEKKLIFPARWQTTTPGSFPTPTSTWHLRRRWNFVGKLWIFAKDLFEDTQPTNEGEGEYSTELYTNKAVQRIRSHNASHPMFLYVAFQAISLLLKKRSSHCKPTPGTSHGPAETAW